MFIYRKTNTAIIIPMIKTTNVPTTPPTITGMLLHDVLGKMFVPIPNLKNILTFKSYILQWF